MLVCSALLASSDPSRCPLDQSPPLQLLAMAEHHRRRVSFKHPRPLPEEQQPGQFMPLPRHYDEEIIIDRGSVSSSSFCVLIHPLFRFCVRASRDPIRRESLARKRLSRSCDHLNQLASQAFTPRLPPIRRRPTKIRPGNLPRSIFCNDQRVVLSLEWRKPSKTVGTWPGQS